MFARCEVVWYGVHAMSHHATEVGGTRRVSTSWHLHRARNGKYVVTETRFYDNGRTVFPMPQRPWEGRALNTALKQVPPHATLVARHGDMPVAWQTLQ